MKGRIKNAKCLVSSKRAQTGRFTNGKQKGRVIGKEYEIGKGGWVVQTKVRKSSKQGGGSVLTISSGGRVGGNSQSKGI